MSFIFFDDPFEYSRYSRLEPEEILKPSATPREFGSMFRYPVGYLRHCRPQASRSTLNFHEDRFQANLDVKQFKPEEISVKVSGDVVTVEGRHEEKEDNQGSISRHFVRKYVVPKGHDLDKIESKLSSDGVLSIIAPKMGVEIGEDRKIPVVQTGVPSQDAENKDQDKEEK